MIMKLDVKAEPTAVEKAYRTALEARERARAAVEQAREAVERGGRALADAAAARSRLAHVPEAVARHRAAAIRDGGDAGAALPRGLLAERQAVFDAEQLVREVRDAQRQLAADEKEAQGSLEEAEMGVRIAARALFAEQIGHVADRLEKIERDAAPLWHELTTFVESFMAGPIDSMRPDIMPHQICTRVHALLHGGTPYEAPNVAQERRKSIQGRLMALIRGEEAA